LYVKHAVNLGHKDTETFHTEIAFVCSQLQNGEGANL